MIELLKMTLAGQCGAAIQMLRGCIEQCEQENWQKNVGKFPFWHVAYHALFFTDLYLSTGQDAFKPPPFHRENYQFFGHHPRFPEKKLVADVPYERPVLLEYAGKCMAKLAEALAAETELTLSGQSGFPWLPFPRAGVYVYNIRHIQHHVGQLSAFLNREQGKAAPWVREHSLNLP